MLYCENRKVEGRAIQNMKKQNRIGGKIACLSLFVVLLGGLAFGNYECYLHETEITTHLCGTGVIVDSSQAQASLLEGDALVRKIAEEGIVLLKNQNNVLPLPVKEKEAYPICLFGVGSTDDGFSYTGKGGSGVATIVPEDVKNEDGTLKYKKNRVTLKEGLEEAGFEIYAPLWKEYESGNKDASFYTDLKNQSLLQAAGNFSDTAVVTISRITGENFSTDELTKETIKGNGLRINDKEIAMLEYVKNHFDKVIVVINSTNTMELGFLEDEHISAALNVGTLGQSGTVSLGRILAGKVSPSGKLADIVPYDTEKDPTFANVIRTAGGDNQITYAEDIYIGYKWYETAEKENYFVDRGGYDAVVQYPFGYGLSYTDFAWNLKSVTAKVDDAETQVKEDMVLEDRKTSLQLEVEVENIGSFPGKDVVEVYYTAPYTKGGIEKSEVNLVAFAKTSILEPNAKETVKISFDLYDMASYDCYDKNHNGFTGWEVEPGVYTISLRKDSHTVDSSFQVHVPETSFDNGKRGFIYRFDIDTKGYVKNRFTGEDAEANRPIDGSGIDEKEIIYLSRSDFKNSFPSTRTPKRTYAKLSSAHSYYYQGWDERNDLQAPRLSRTDGEMLYIFTLENGDKASKKDLDGTGAPLKANEDLIMELGGDFKNEKWDQLLSQLEPSEINSMIATAGFGTKSVESIGKPNLLDYDGSNGFNSKMSDPAGDTAWTGYPGEAVMAQTWNKDLAFEMGRALGSEAKVTGGMTGMYAPCVNLHRTPYNTRNYEAYSEDGVLSGYLAANLIYGAKTNGLSCYIKHLALSEEGWNPNDCDTWLTEQNLRENYLKPFEIAVKKGKANAVMSAFNRIGAVRCVNSYALLTQVLRKEWGFKGSVITDYNMGVIDEHVRAGNDLHLYPMDGSAVQSWLNPKDKVELYTGYMAVKNSLYSYCNTYYTAKNYDPSASLGLSQKKEIFVWWKPALIAIDVIVIGLMGFWTFQIFRPRKKKTPMEGEKVD